MDERTRTSKIPRMTRQATKPSKFWTAPMHVMTIPQAITRKDSQRLGLTFFSMMLEGISAPASAVNSGSNHRLSLTEDDVGNKEDGAGNVVLIPNQAEVLVHAFDLCIPDVSSVDMGEKVQNTHDGDEPKINLHVTEVSVTSVMHFCILANRIGDCTFRTTCFPRLPS